VGKGDQFTRVEELAIGGDQTKGTALFRCCPRQAPVAAAQVLAAERVHPPALRESEGQLQGVPRADEHEEIQPPALGMAQDKADRTQAQRGRGQQDPGCGQVRLVEGPDPVGEQREQGRLQQEGGPHQERGHYHDALRPPAPGAVGASSGKFR